jgi:hypothetical protein
MAASVTNDRRASRRTQMSDTNGATGAPQMLGRYEIG